MCVQFPFTLKCIDVDVESKSDSVCLRLAGDFTQIRTELWSGHEIAGDLFRVLFISFSTLGFCCTKIIIVMVLVKIVGVVVGR